MKYRVTVDRIVEYETKTFEVAADSQDEANALAIDRAAESDPWTAIDIDYNIENTEEIRHTQEEFDHYHNYHHNCTDDEDPLCMTEWYREYWPTIESILNQGDEPMPVETKNQGTAVDRAIVAIYTVKDEVRLHVTEITPSACASENGDVIVSINDLNAPWEFDEDDELDCALMEYVRTAQAAKAQYIHFC